MIISKNSNYVYLNINSEISIKVIELIEFEKNKNAVQYLLNIKKKILKLN